jgi:predicted metal-dependent phosphoesterase TrpH
MPIRCLFHIHTRYSFDSLLKPSTILGRARAMKADLLIVTDHESKRGSDHVARLAAGYPPLVVPAGEYKTEKGDLIGLFLKEEITSRDSNEVLREIHDQDGLVVLPHPFKSHKLDDELLSQVDLIEVTNSRCSESQNSSAEILAGKHGKPVMGGCDAHCAGEIGAVVTEFDCEPPFDERALRTILLSAPRNILAKKVSRVYQPCSQLIKAWKTRNPILFAYQMKQLAGVLAREAFSQ